MIPKPLRWIAAGAAVAAVVFAAQAVLKNRPSEPQKLSAEVRREKIVESVYGIGTVKANKSFQFKPGIVTTVHRLFVKEGDSVAQGQNLFELEKGAVVSAPFAGTVTALPVKVGENVFSQTVVLEIVDLSDRYVVVSLEQRAAVRVRRGQTARLSFENLREKSYSGVVESVYSSGSDFLVRIETAGLPPEILPGMTADTAIAVGERADALLVPVTAIDEGSVRVQRAGGGVFKTAVEIGVVDGEFAEVLSGDVQPGDRVFVPADRKP